MSINYPQLGGGWSHGSAARARATREWLESESAFIALGVPLFLRPLTPDQMEGVDSTKAQTMEVRNARRRT